MLDELPGLEDVDRRGGVLWKRFDHVHDAVLAEEHFKCVVLDDLDGAELLGLIALTDQDAHCAVGF